MDSYYLINFQQIMLIIKLAKYKNGDIDLDIENLSNWMEPIGFDKNSFISRFKDEHILR